METKRIFSSCIHIEFQINYYTIHQNMKIFFPTQSLEFWSIRNTKSVTFLRRSRHFTIPLFRPRKPKNKLTTVGRRKKSLLLALTLSKKAIKIALTNFVGEPICIHIVRGRNFLQSVPLEYRSKEDVVLLRQPYTTAKL